MLSVVWPVTWHVRGSAAAARTTSLALKRASGRAYRQQWRNGLRLHLRNASISSANSQEADSHSRFFGTEDVILGSVTSDTPFETSIDELLEPLKQRHGTWSERTQSDENDRISTLCLLLTPTFARYALDTDFILRAVQIFAELQPANARGTVDVATAVVDKLPVYRNSEEGKQEQDTAQEGLGYYFSARLQPAFSIEGVKGLSASESPIPSPPTAQNWRQFSAQPQPGTLNFTAVTRAFQHNKNINTALTLQLPLAQTVFTTGKVSTLLLTRCKPVSSDVSTSPNYEVESGGRLISEPKHLGVQLPHPTRDPRLLRLTANIPLIPLTPLRRVEHTVGNILRRVAPFPVAPLRVHQDLGSVSGDERSIIDLRSHDASDNTNLHARPASTELEEAITAYFTTTDQIQRAVQVWALVIPASRFTSSRWRERKESRALATLEDAARKEAIWRGALVPDVAGDFAEESAYSSMDLQYSDFKLDALALEALCNDDGQVKAFEKVQGAMRLILRRQISYGAKFCKVLSGGGGWGKKAGLLSLDFETGYDHPSAASTGVGVDLGLAGLPNLDLDLDLDAEALEVGSETPAEAKRRKLGGLVSEGDGVVFFMAEEGFEAGMRESFAKAPRSEHHESILDRGSDTTAPLPDQHSVGEEAKVRVPAALFGVLPSSIDSAAPLAKSAQPDAQATTGAKVVHHPNVFGMLSEGGMALTVTNELPNPNHADVHPSDEPVSATNASPQVVSADASHGFWVQKTKLDVPNTVLRLSFPIDSDAGKTLSDGSEVTRDEATPGRASHATNTATTQEARSRPRRSRARSKAAAANKSDDEIQSTRSRRTQTQAWSANASGWEVWDQALAGRQIKNDSGPSSRLHHRPSFLFSRESSDVPVLGPEGEQRQNPSGRAILGSPGAATMKDASDHFRAPEETSAGDEPSSADVAQSWSEEKLDAVDYFQAFSETDDDTNASLSNVHSAAVGSSDERQPHTAPQDAAPAMKSRKIPEQVPAVPDTTSSMPRYRMSDTFPFAIKLPDDNFLSSTGAGQDEAGKSMAPKSRKARSIASGVITNSGRVIIRKHQAHGGWSIRDKPSTEAERRRMMFEKTTGPSALSASWKTSGMSTGSSTEAHGLSTYHSPSDARFSLLSKVSEDQCDDKVEQATTASSEGGRTASFAIRLSHARKDAPLASVSVLADSKNEAGGQSTIREAEPERDGFFTTPPSNAHKYGAPSVERHFKTAAKKKRRLRGRADARGWSEERARPLRIVRVVQAFMNMRKVARVDGPANESSMPIIRAQAEGGLDNNVAVMTQTPISKLAPTSVDPPSAKPNIPLPKLRALRRTIVREGTRARTGPGPGSAFTRRSLDGLLGVVHMLDSVVHRVRSDSHAVSQETQDTIEPRLRKLQAAMPVPPEVPAHSTSALPNARRLHGQERLERARRKRDDMWEALQSSGVHLRTVSRASRIDADVIGGTFSKHTTLPQKLRERLMHDVQALFKSAGP